MVERLSKTSGLEPLVLSLCGLLSLACMVVRLRWRKRRFPVPLASQTLALALASLLAPSAVLAFSITFWSFAVDLHWTATFFVSRGVFAHWRSWLMASAALLTGAWLLGYYADTARERSLPDSSGRVNVA